jgi:hypothetical protein
MNKKLILAAALVFGVAGLILAQGTVKAQDAAVNSTDNSITTTTTDNSITTTTDNSTVNVDNTAAPAAEAAPTAEAAPAAEAAPTANAAQ